MKLENKFLVLKNADIDAALDARAKFFLSQIVGEVARYRQEHGKPENSYVVINLDESYALEVLKLIEQAGPAPERSE